MQNNVNLSPEAIRVINALQHKNGTYNYYRATIDRIYTYILHASDEIGMSDTETIHTLRALDGIRLDLKDLAGRSISEAEGADTSEHVAAPVDVITMKVDFSDPQEKADEAADTSDEFQDSNYSASVDKLDEPREMLADVKMAWQRLNEVQNIISEAITHAQNAGDKYDSVISDLANVNGDMEALTASLDAVMAINPDTYEPKELTEAEKTAMFVQRSRGALTYGKELLDDALIHATRVDYKPLTRKLLSVRELTITAINAVAELAERADNTLKGNEH